MSRKWMYIIGGVIFIGGAIGVAVVAKSRLPKTSKAHVSVQECRFNATPELTYDLNETIRLTVTSDKDTRLTIENYNVELALQANQAASTTFKTTRSGVFDVKVSGCDDHIMLNVRDANGKLPEASDHTTTDSDHAEPKGQTPPNDTTAPAPAPAEGGHDNATPHH